MTTPSRVWIGPIELNDGVKAVHFLTLVLIAFLCVPLMSKLQTMNAYILAEHLLIPRSEMGTVSGNLMSVQEIAIILCIIPLGLLVDKSGRRPILLLSIGIICLTFVFYPFAETFSQLAVIRGFFAAGVGGMGSVTITLANDLTAEGSRGKVVGVYGATIALGHALYGVTVVRIAEILVGQGWQPVAAGKAMFLTSALIAFCAWWAVWIGLRGWNVIPVDQRPPWRVLATSGVRAARNPRIALSYLGMMTGRSDLAVKNTFLAAWASVAAADMGFSQAEALARFGVIIAISEIARIAWGLIFGVIMDRILRITAFAIAMAIAGIGYCSMAFITNPLDYAMLPIMALLFMATASSVNASYTLIGQEASAKERGSIIAMSNLVTAIFIMWFMWYGGRQFDLVGPWAPFVLIGGYQFLLCLAAIWCRIVAPGAKPGLAVEPAPSKT